MKCFLYNKNRNIDCDKKKCRYWIENSLSNNCCINYVNNDDFDSDKITLQDIGDIFKVTRMRICQIEKIAIKKIKDKITSRNLA